MYRTLHRYPVGRPFVATRPLRRRHARNTSVLAKSVDSSAPHIHKVDLCITDPRGLALSTQFAIHAPCSLKEFACGRCMCLAMVKCLLTLSNCTYTITSEDADRLRRCLEQEEKTVRLHLDLFGEGKLSEVCLSVQHIVAIAEYPVSDMSITAELDDRVTPLRR